MIELENRAFPDNRAPQPPPDPQLALRQLKQKYNALVGRYRALEEENTQLREEIEQFNQKLIARETSLEEMQRRLDGVAAYFRQTLSEEARLPHLHAAAAVRQRYVQELADLAARAALPLGEVVPEQDLFPLNVWLATKNRFVDKVIGHYVRQRDRVLVIEDYALVKQLIATGMLPDIIITGAYDFGIDDPTHLDFFTFLDQLFGTSAHAPHDFFVITLSSTIPVESHCLTTPRHVVRHEVISKFRGLQVTISEARYFLEMRRCRHDIMTPEMSLTVRSMGDVARLMLELQQQARTGVLVIFSDASPTNIRWAFLLFFMRGKLIKTEHTLESSVLFPTVADAEPLQKIFTLASLEEKYELNPPQQVYFFPLAIHALLREIGQTAETILPVV